MLRLCSARRARGDRVVRDARGAALVQPVALRDHRVLGVLHGLLAAPEDAEAGQGGGRHKGGAGCRGDPAASSAEEGTEATGDGEPLAPFQPGARPALLAEMVSLPYVAMTVGQTRLFVHSVVSLDITTILYIE